MILEGGRSKWTSCFPLHLTGRDSEIGTSSTSDMRIAAPIRESEVQPSSASTRLSHCSPPWMLSFDRPPWLPVFSR